MSEQQLSFLCIGSSSQDVYLHNVDGLDPVCLNPEDCFFNIHLGDKIYVNKVDFMTGGGASNASVTFARGGQKAYFMGLIGCDPAASACLASFTARESTLNTFPIPNAITLIIQLCCWLPVASELF